MVHCHLGYGRQGDQGEQGQRKDPHLFHRDGIIGPATYLRSGIKGKSEHGEMIIKLGVFTLAESFAVIIEALR